MNLLQMDDVSISSFDFWKKLNEIRESEGGSKIRHDDFLCRVEDECDEFGVCDQFAHPQNGQPMKRYHLNKDQMLLVGMRESKIVRKKVLEWIKSLSRELSRKELALMVIKEAEEKEAALLEVDRLQGVCNTITAQFSPGVTAPKFCKQLKGVNTQQVNNKLCDMGMLVRGRGGIAPTSYSRDRYFTERQEEHEGKVRSYAILTLKGAKWLYRAYLSNKLPMKNDWDGGFVHIVFDGNSNYLGYV